MKDKLIINILVYLKNCDDKMDFIDPNKLLKMSDNSKNVIYTLRELIDRGYIDSQQIKISTDGYIVPSNMHRPILTESGLAYLEENTK